MTRPWQAACQRALTEPLEYGLRCDAENCGDTLHRVAPVGPSDHCRSIALVSFSISPNAATASAIRSGSRLVGSVALPRHPQPEPGPLLALRPTSGYLGHNANVDRIIAVRTRVAQGHAAAAPTTADHPCRIHCPCAALRAVPIVASHVVRELPTVRHELVPIDISRVRVLKKNGYSSGATATVPSRSWPGCRRTGPAPSAIHIGASISRILQVFTRTTGAMFAARQTTSCGAGPCSGRTGTTSCPRRKHGTTASRCVTPGNSAKTNRSRSCTSSSGLKMLRRRRGCGDQPKR